METYLENSAQISSAVNLTLKSSGTSVSQSVSSKSQSTTSVTSSVTSSSSTLHHSSTETASVSQNQSTSRRPLTYKCNACKVHTPYLLMMVKHLKFKHPQIDCFACPYCKKTICFSSQKQLRTHVKQNHPDKVTRNEISLSDSAKKLVEAMVLPMSPDCVQVGNRLVLEEDIHTCTYCHKKMTSLAGVYEHLNETHSDLFEFVCPVCQNFKHKNLTDIANHCTEEHQTPLNTDKVHVSVPKNLFSVLTCISKKNKYIEKNLETPSLPVDPSEYTVDNSKSVPVTLADGGLSTTYSNTFPILPSTQAITVSTPIVGNLGTPLVAFSSALFDTTTLQAQSSTVRPINILTNAAVPINSAGIPAASSFLSPLQPSQTSMSSKPQSKSVQHEQSPSKPYSKLSQKNRPILSRNLPVLNVPSIKSFSSSSSSQKPINILCPPTINVDEVPDVEPNPDAFKIFNLKPVASPLPVSSFSTSTSSSINSPSACIDFPPSKSQAPSVDCSTRRSPAVTATFLHAVSESSIMQPSITTTYAPGMALQSALMQQAVQYQMPGTSTGGLTFNISTPEKVGAQSSPLISASSPQTVSISPYLKHQKEMAKNYQRLMNKLTLSSLTTNPPIAKVNSLVSQQQHHQLSQISSHTVSSLPQSPVTSPSFGQASGPLHISPPTLANAPTEAPSNIPSSSLADSQSSKSQKGIHKRSNCLYQCPYCTKQTVLKAIEVPSHIQQEHPGYHVLFKKIT